MIGNSVALFSDVKINTETYSTLSDLQNAIDEEIFKHLGNVKIKEQYTFLQVLNSGSMNIPEDCNKIMIVSPTSGTGVYFMAKIDAQQFVLTINNNLEEGKLNLASKYTMNANFTQLTHNLVRGSNSTWSNARIYRVDLIIE